MIGVYKAVQDGLQLRKCIVVGAWTEFYKFAIESAER